MRNMYLVFTGQHHHLCYLPTAPLVLPADRRSPQHGLRGWSATTLMRRGTST